MRIQANAKRKDAQFQLGEWVWLKSQPYWQRTLARRSSNKLARRYYGPFQITERIGAVAYQLGLPVTAKLHNVFHISRLKRFIGDPSSEPRFLPDEYINQHPLREPEAIIQRMNVLKLGKNFSELLVKWKGQSAEEATWEDAKDFQVTFPNFILEDKDISKGGANVAKERGKTVLQYQTSTTGVSRRSARETQGKYNSRFKDFVMN